MSLAEPVGRHTMTASSKSDIRTEALSRRAGVLDSVRAGFASRLATVGAGLVRSEQDPFGNPVVSLFLPVRGEPDTLPLIEVLAKVDLPTALPVIQGRRQPLQFRRWVPGEPLEVGPWGIGHPSEEALPVVPDVLFVPLAAYDRRGARIGYGAGYYDATLAALRRVKTVRAIGVAFACQEVLYIPTESHDEPLDLVLTDRDIIICEP